MRKSARSFGADLRAGLSRGETTAMTGLLEKARRAVPTRDCTGPATRIAGDVRSGQAREAARALFLAVELRRCASAKFGAVMAAAMDGMPLRIYCGTATYL